MNRNDELSRIILPILSPYASRVALFGSFARGDESSSSDIDVLIRLRPPGNRPTLGLEYFEIEAELGERLGRKVELVTEDALSPHVRRYVDEDLVVLYED